MQYRKKKEQIAFEVIEAAIGGDAVAINQIIDYFQPYINSRCRRKFIDESGRTTCYVTERTMYIMEDCHIMSESSVTSSQISVRFQSLTS